MFTNKSLPSDQIGEFRMRIAVEKNNVWRRWTIHHEMIR